MKQLMASRRAFENALCLSVTADDGRLGNRTRLVAAAVLPSNVGCWLAPQVLGRQCLL